MDRPVHLDWFINSLCDWTCNRCLSPATPPRPDLGLADRMVALDSFADFAQQTGRAASIAFYPRQATFTHAFTQVLRAAQEHKRAGLLRRMTTVNRGDLSADKIETFAQFGIDSCRVTIDGPEAVQDALRRPDSFRDTLESFRRIRQAGIVVSPMMLIVRFNAAYVAETMKLMLAEGFAREFVLQVAIRAESNGDNAQAKAGHGNPLWNEQLSAGEYRAVLLAALGFVDSLGPGHADYRRRFILAHPMFARLFHEIGRMDEYCQATKSDTDGLTGGPALRFGLRPTGEVSAGPDAGVQLGSFPGGSFMQMYRSVPALAGIKSDACRIPSLSRADARFAKCRDCPAAAYCPPKLVAAIPSGPVFRPDEHCWV